MGNASAWLLRASQPARPPARVAPLEIGALALALSSYIWLWNGAFRGHVALILLLYFGIGFETHWRRRETLRDLGLRLDNLGGGLWLVGSWVGPVVLLTLGAGRLLDTWQFPPFGVSVGSVVFGVLWGTAQQYGLVCVFYRRFSEVLPGEKLPIIAAGVLFGLFHLPNPFLTVLTAILGPLACWLFRREPNLFALGIWHGVTSFVLFHALPVWLTMQLRVGPQILPYLAWPF